MPPGGRQVPTLADRSGTARRSRLHRHSGDEPAGILDRRFRAMDSALLASRAPMARQLSELRKIAAQLDPGRLKLGGSRSPDDEMRELDRYFERFGDAQPRLEGILADLDEGRFAPRPGQRRDRHGAVLAGHGGGDVAPSTRCWPRVSTTPMTERLDPGIADADPARADVLRVDVLTVVRRRRSEILTQQAIATQGSAALRVVATTTPR